MGYNGPVCRLVGKYIDGGKIIGYQLVGIDGKIFNIKKEELEKLALNGMVENCTVIQYNGVNYLKGVGMRLSDLPALSMRAGIEKNTGLNNAGVNPALEIVARLMSGTRVVGYVVQDIAGKQYKLSKEKVWELAREKIIINAIAQVCNKQKILRGVGMELRQLKCIEV